MKLINIALLIFAIAWGCVTQGRVSTDYYLLIGTYTDEESEGIYLFRFDSESGSLDSIGLAASTENPSYLAVSPDNSTVYAVNEVGDSTNARISAFTFNRKNASLSFMNSRTSRGGAPCYVSIDSEGRAVFAGNYSGGSVAMFPVNANGSLREAKTTIQYEGNSVNSKRQGSSHVHCTYLSPDNKYLFVTDLGTDRVTSYLFNASIPSLELDSNFVYTAQPGAGPRHLTFHPNGRFAYLINELNGTITAFNQLNGVLDPVQTVSNVPSGYSGPISGADIHLSPDARFLYASNREDLNNIVIYSVNQVTGRLTKLGEQITGGAHPRNFVIDPMGNYLLVANRHTNNITVFKRDRETGMLTPTGVEVHVSQPVCLKMVPVG